MGLWLFGQVVFYSGHQEVRASLVAKRYPCEPHDPGNAMIVPYETMYITVVFFDAYLQERLGDVS